MQDIHRSSTTWLARWTGRGSAARPPHRSHRRRLTLEPLEGRALLSLTTWTVNSLGDTGTGSGTSGDLRYVITQADKTTGDNTINFAVTGTITLNSALPDLSNTTGVMDIEGPGAASLTVARSSTSETDFSVFTVDANVQAQLVGLTITGGSASNGGGIDNAGTLAVTNSTMDYNSASGSGGGIYNAAALTVTNSRVDNNSGASYGGGIDNDGTLTVTNSIIADNSGAYYGGGIDNDGTLIVTNSTIDYNSASYGGGIGNLVGCTLTVTNSTIADNWGTYFGGGIDNAGLGTLIVTNSTIDNNSCTDYGGGINNYGTLTVTNSTIDNNSASGSIGTGGGIDNDGTLTVTNSTIADNSAGGSFGGGEGGGIENGFTLTVTNSTIADNSASYGGGINNWGRLTVTNSTIADNSASDGGGIDNGGGFVNDGVGIVTVTNSTIADNSASWGGGINSAGTLTVNNALIAVNTDYTGSGATANDIAGTGSATGAYNLIGTGGSGGLVNGVDGNQVGVTNPGLNPNGLQNNGGPTQTIALLSGSPAIGAGSIALAVDPTTGLPLTTDQRGPWFPRIVNGTVDIGAYEFHAESLVTTQPPASVVAGSGFGLTVTAEDSAGNVDTAFNGTVTVALAGNSGGSTLGGTLSVTAVKGVATFSGLTLNEPGTGYTLAVFSGALTTATTSAFNVFAPFFWTWTVNSLGDSGTGSGTSGDLRYVITHADQNVGNNTIKFAVTGTITLNSALPDLSNTTGVMDIEGPGAASLTVARSSAAGTPGFGVFTVDANVQAQLVGLTITGGSASNGGGIDNAGTMTVTGSTIADNSATNQYPGGGGGIYNAGTLTVTDSTIDNNSASNNGNGGGIDNTGTLTVTDCTIDDNSASTYYVPGVGSPYSNVPDGGGGIANTGTITLIDSTVSGNSDVGSAAEGGGIDSSGTLTVTGCSIVGNQANGGPFFSGLLVTGGGIWANGSLEISDSTISGNSATDPGGNGEPFGAGAYGGGLYLLGTAAITNVTISGNNAAGGPGGGSVIINGGPGGGPEFIGGSGGSAEGGGLQFAGEALTMTNTTIYGNTASGGNGGDGWQLADWGYNGQGGTASGGGIASVSAGSATLVNCTVSGNSVSGGYGGGWWVNEPGVFESFPDTQASSDGNDIEGSVDIGSLDFQSQIATVAVDWGTQTAALQTASDGLRLLPAGRNTDLPWLGIDQVLITLTQPAALAAGDITVIGSSGTNYGPVTVSGSGTSYTITLAQPINAADRVTIIIGNDLIATFTRRLDVLPGDVNDDGVVNVQDMVAIRNQMLGLLGAVPTIFGDINGDGKVDINDYTAVRKLIGTTLPRIT